MTILTNPPEVDHPYQRLIEQLASVGFTLLHCEQVQHAHWTPHTTELKMDLSYEVKVEVRKISELPPEGSLGRVLWDCKNDLGKMLQTQIVTTPDGARWIIHEVRHEIIRASTHMLSLTLRELRLAPRRFEGTDITVKLGNESFKIKNFETLEPGEPVKEIELPSQRLAKLQADPPPEDPWSGIYLSYQTPSGGACVETATGKQLDELAALWGLTRGTIPIERLGSAKPYLQPESDCQLRSRLQQARGAAAKRAHEQAEAKLAPSYDPGSTIQPEGKLPSPLHEAICKRKADTFWGVPQDFNVPHTVPVTVDLKINSDGSIPVVDTMEDIKRAVLEHIQQARIHPSPQNVATGLKMLVDPKTQAQLIQRCEITQPNNGSVVVTMQLHEQAINTGVLIGTIRRIVVDYLKQVLPVTCTFETLFLSHNEAQQRGW